MTDPDGRDFRDEIVQRVLRGYEEIAIRERWLRSGEKGPGASDLTHPECYAKYIAALDPQDTMDFAEVYKVSIVTLADFEGVNPFCTLCGDDLFS